MVRVKVTILIFAGIIDIVQGRSKFCTQRYCHKCEQVVATGEPENLYRKCEKIYSTPGCCDIYRAGSGGLFRVFTFQKCDGVKSLEDFSFEEIKSDTELLKSTYQLDDRRAHRTVYIESTVEPVIEPCFDKDNQKIDCKTGELYFDREPTIELKRLEICLDKDNQEIDCKTEELYTKSKEELGKAEARFYQDCEFSMESPGMIFMYGATLVLVVLAIIGIYIAKRKTQLKQRLAIGEDAIGSGILSAFLTIIPTFDRRSSRSSKKASTRRKSKTESEKILSSTP